MAETMARRPAATATANVLALCLMSSCGPSNGATDSGAAHDGARPPPCTVPDFLGPPPAAECGLCVDGRERVVGPHTWLIFETDAVAVEEGLLVGMQAPDVRVSLVTRDGAVVVLDELPYFSQRGALPWYHMLRPIPGASQVWVITNRLDYMADVTLYRYDATGFERLASGRAPFLYPVVALATGELVARAVDGPSVNERLVRLRALPDGSVDILEPVESPVEGEFNRGFWWPHRSRGIFVLALTGTWEERGGTRYSHSDALLYHLDEELRPMSEPVLLGADPFDPRYTGEPEFSEATPYVAAIQRHMDGSASIVSVGTLPATGAAPESQFWIQSISPEGEVRFPRPGILANARGFERREDTSFFRFYVVTFGPLGHGDLAISWLPERVPVGGGPRPLQIVRSSGELVFPEPLDLGWPSHPDLREDRFPPDVEDGSGHAFAIHIDFLTGVFEGSTRRTFGLEGYDSTMRHAWPSRVRVSACPERVGEALYEVVGDVEDGVWVVWAELLEEDTGRDIWITKATWVRSDGSFAW